MEVILTKVRHVSGNSIYHRKVLWGYYQFTITYHCQPRRLVLCQRARATQSTLSLIAARMSEQAEAAMVCRQTMRQHDPNRERKSECARLFRTHVNRDLELSSAVVKRSIYCIPLLFASTVTLV